VANAGPDGDPGDPAFKMNADPVPDPRKILQRIFKRLRKGLFLLESSHSQTFLFLFHCASQFLDYLSVYRLCFFLHFGSF
jgi:hypothetical protein